MWQHLCLSLGKEKNNHFDVYGLYVCVCACTSREEGKRR